MTGQSFCSLVFSLLCRLSASCVVQTLQDPAGQRIYQRYNEQHTNQYQKHCAPIVFARFVKQKEEMHLQAHP
jgi:hypothetical protein